ncbi:MAG: BamA/TamA family outer membrane protein [Bacteroidales bacterium]|jgi:hypothetical protein|nr:BamA/TamA family outer membrane protein [Bacteroidales bacterium]
MRSFILLIIAISTVLTLTAQSDTSRNEKVKTGWNLGALPSVLFNSDLGFQYGALANIYNYGDGRMYPDYKYSIYTEWARTTKGGGINQLFFDSKYLLPFDIRITADFSYLTQQALDFYGFNGYDALYHPEWETDSDPNYVSRMFYRVSRNLLRTDVGFQRKINGKSLLGLIGFSFMDIASANVDLDALNKGKDPEDLLPDVPGLFQKYKDWGLIDAPDADGGKVSFIKLGLIYDTRDNEPNPMTGVWSEVILAISPECLGANQSFTKISATHRQYFTLINEVLSLAVRGGYQGTISGKTPFYMQSYMINSFPRSTTVDGLGGSRSLRGILRNRVVGDAIAYGNIEMRWKFWRKYALRQNFYGAFSAFVDAGRVVKKHEVNMNLVPDVERVLYFSETGEAWHPSIGFGLRLAMNQNFVVAVDYGRAIDKRDGNSGVYIGLNFLF